MLNSTAKRKTKLLRSCSDLIQVKNLNFYDVVLDFILMDSFEDLENPPISIQNVVNNRWLNSSFKETVSICLIFIIMIL